MKIGIDARTILNPAEEEAPGIGHYASQLIRHLFEIDKKNQYVLFFDRRVNDRDISQYKKAKVEIKYFPFHQYKKFLPGIYSEMLITASLKKEKLDVFHSPKHSIPSTYRNKNLITVHDLATFKHPKLFSRKRISQSKKALSATLKRCQKIIAVSESTKNDLNEIFKIPKRKIEVVYNGLDRIFFSPPREEEMRKVLNKYKVKGKYILFLGTLEPRRNIPRLLEAYASLKRKESLDYQLVLAGKEGWLASEFKQMVSDFDLRKEVIFTGYVPPKELNSLIRKAEIFVSPSIYEGFGMPVIEAMACGVPVITSNVSSLPEIAGEAALFVSPYDIGGLAGTIRRLLRDKKLQVELKEKGQKQARQFSWPKCAQETLKVYEGLKKSK